MGISKNVRDTNSIKLGQSYAIWCLLKCLVLVSTMQNAKKIDKKYNIRQNRGEKSIAKGMNWLRNLGKWFDHSFTELLPISADKLQIVEKCTKKLMCIIIL